MRAELTAMIEPLAADGISTLPSRTATRADEGRGGSDTTPDSPGPPSPWNGLYCTTAIGTPTSDGSSARSHAQ